MLGIIIKEKHAKIYQNPTNAAGIPKPSRMQGLGMRNADPAMDRLFLPGGHPDNSPPFQVSIYKKVSKSQDRNLQNKSMIINTQACSHITNLTLETDRKCSRKID